MKKQLYTTEQTKKNLINSFWELYKKEDISKITIGKICNTASYERTTFYRYFTDITDILNHVEDEIIENIKKDIQNSEKNSNTSSIFFDGFKRFTDKYGEYIVIFHEKGNRHFYIKFKELIKKDVYEYLNFNIKDENQKEFLFEFLFSSLINSYTYWYRNQKIMDLETFVKFTNNILLNGTNSIINYNNKDQLFIATSLYY